MPADPDPTAAPASDPVAPGPPCWGPGSRLHRQPLAGGCSPQPHPQGARPSVRSQSEAHSGFHTRGDVAVTEATPSLSRPRPETPGDLPDECTQSRSRKEGRSSPGKLAAEGRRRTLRPAEEPGGHGTRRDMTDDSVEHGSSPKSTFDRGPAPHVGPRCRHREGLRGGVAGSPRLFPRPAPATQEPPAESRGGSRGAGRALRFLPALRLEQARHPLSASPFRPVNRVASPASEELRELRAGERAGRLESRELGAHSTAGSWQASPALSPDQNASPVRETPRGRLL